MNKSFRIIALAAIFAGAACGVRAELIAQLMLGDKAPALHTGQWVQGEPVQSFDTNHIYIVEFWATWCGPCIASIPHLNQLWERFKDKGVIVIGQDISDGDYAVPPFVKKMGTNMTYRVVLDDKSRDTNGWMCDYWCRKVSRGIPTSFIINRDGAIAWIGHPLDLNDALLNDIISGHYDLARAAVEAKARGEKDDKLNGQLLELNGKLNAAIADKRWDNAHALLDQMEKVSPGSEAQRPLPRMKILLGQAKFDEACQFVETLSAAHATNAAYQNALAWTILTADSSNDRSLALAENMAERAVQLSKEQNAADLDTLARAQFVAGKKQEAIATEEKALDLKANPPLHDTIEKTLASYRAGMLPKAE